MTAKQLPQLRMNAYYYSFEPTGVRAVDEILSAVAVAGTAYASKSHEALIQEAADRAAAAMTETRIAASDASLVASVAAEAIMRRVRLGGTDAITYESSHKEIRVAMEFFVGDDGDNVKEVLS